MKTALKYISIAILGTVLFVITNRAALPERPSGGIGGEAVLLALPLFWWIVERTVKDLLRDFERMWREIKAERATKNGSDSADRKQAKK